MAYICTNCGNQMPESDSPCTECAGEEFVAVVESTGPEPIDNKIDVTYVCKECGAEHPRNSPPCRECGGLQFSAVRDSPSDDGGHTAAEDSGGFSIRWRVGLTAIVLGCGVGFIAAWILSRTSYVGWVWLFGWGFSAAFLYRRDGVSDAIGSALYVSALGLLLVPIGNYLPYVWNEPSGVEETGLFIGGLVGLVVYGFVFLLLAIVVAGVGYFFKKRAASQRLRDL